MFPNRHRCEDPGKGGVGERCVSRCSSPSPLQAEKISLGEGLSSSSEAGQGCFQFASWNSGRAWGVCHYRICTPIKANFGSISSASRLHPIPTTSPSLPSWVRFRYPLLITTRPSCEIFRGAPSVRAGLCAVSSAAVGGNYNFKQGPHFCITFCFQRPLSCWILRTAL